MPRSRVQVCVIASPCMFFTWFGSAVYVNRYIQLSAYLFKDRGAPLASEASHFFLWTRHMRYRLHIMGFYTYVVAPYLWPHKWNVIMQWLSEFWEIFDCSPWKGTLWLLQRESFTERVVLQIYPPIPSAGLSLGQTCLKIEMEYYFSLQVISCSYQEFVTVCWSLFFFFFNHESMVKAKHVTSYIIIWMQRGT